MATIKQVRLVFTPKASSDPGISAFNKLIISTQKSPTVLRPSDRIQMSKARAGKGHIMAELVREGDCLVAVFNDHRVADCFHLTKVGEKIVRSISADAKTRGNYNVGEEATDLGFSAELIETELVLAPAVVEETAAE